MSSKHKSEDYKITAVKYYIKSKAYKVKKYHVKYLLDEVKINKTITMNE